MVGSDSVCNPTGKDAGGMDSTAESSAHGIEPAANPLVASPSVSDIHSATFSAETGLRFLPESQLLKLPVSMSLRRQNSAWVPFQCSL